MILSDTNAFTQKPDIVTEFYELIGMPAKDVLVCGISMHIGIQAGTHLSNPIDIVVRIHTYAATLAS